MSILTAAIAIIAAYLLGSISFAVVVTRALGIQDPRTYGSGNPGATNVLRSGSKKAAILTLLFDALKGYIPAVLALWLAPLLGWSAYVVAGVALGAFLGHLYPVYFQFKGGKGVATAAGIILGLSPLTGLAILATWLLIAVVFRYSSLAALVAAICAPIYYYFIQGYPASMPILVAIIIIVVLMIYRHKQNIQNLLAHKESKIGKKKE
ncbi:putative glycerol-3-phosphate acyltransferase [Saezia sanguinis]|uniref:Glycerol-3-phosphate acyltransferase n=2 Tax=Saezia sanguinis TaxID=1965230 RepID=A0A433SFH5_9BURK|nr:glycerol-3-phosphate 1-O-acyltransferase PlsY [Saezia sanguinis]RUS67519.1 putative glycerol-3-phosphate acyltransferase [Saezia sanguinis]